MSKSCKAFRVMDVSLADDAVLFAEGQNGYDSAFIEVCKWLECKCAKINLWLKRRVILRIEGGRLWKFSEFKYFCLVIDKNGEYKKKWKFVWPKEEKLEIHTINGLISDTIWGLYRWILLPAL